MDYANIIWLLNTIAIGLFFLMLIFGWYYIAAIIISGKKVKPVPHSDNKSKFAIIIPARNEAKVIRHSLESLKKQTYDSKYYDIWVIIESEKDPTALICKKMGVNYFVRKDLENKHTKGYAIQELDNYFVENNIEYDAYLIFDADNMASRKYIEVMNDLRQTGVQVGMGYRNFTNASQNWLTCTSATFFAYMFTYTARMRTNLFKKSTVCGTGFYIDTQVVRDAGGWIFTGMTEDTQITTYCYYHDVNMRYYPLVEFYDEQCSNFKDSHKQKLRWIWGYFASRKEFKKETVDYHSSSDKQRFWSKVEYNFSIYPFAVFSVVNLLLWLASFIFALTSLIFNPEYTATLIGFSFVQFAILYGTYMFIPLLVIIKDNKKLKFNFATIVWTVLTYILFFGDILLAVLDGIIHKSKRHTWDAIHHNGKLTHRNAKTIDKKCKK